jgi:hypothetical protein
MQGVCGEIIQRIWPCQQKNPNRVFLESKIIQIRVLVIPSGQEKPEISPASGFPQRLAGERRGLTATALLAFGAEFVWSQGGNPKPETGGAG